MCRSDNLLPWSVELSVLPNPGEPRRGCCALFWLAVLCPADLVSTVSLLSQLQKAVILISNDGNSYSLPDERLFLFYPACSIISPTCPHSIYKTWVKSFSLRESFIDRFFLSLPYVHAYVIKHSHLYAEPEWKLSSFLPQLVSRCQVNLDALSKQKI